MTLAAARAPRRADWRFMLLHPTHAMALGFGSGLSPRAPGTVGTLWAWASFLLLDRWLGSAGWAAVLLLGLGLGVWACTRCAQHLGTADPGAIVWDEIIAFWAVLWLIGPAGWAAQLLAFALFVLGRKMSLGSDVLFNPTGTDILGAAAIVGCQAIDRVLLYGN